MNKKVQRDKNLIECVRRDLILAPMEKVVNFLYPKIYNITELRDIKEGVSDEELFIPSCVNPNRVNLKNDSIYLIDDSHCFVLLIMSDFEDYDSYFSEEAMGKFEFDEFPNLAFSQEKQAGVRVNHLIEHLNLIYDNFDLPLITLYEK